MSYFILDEQMTEPVKKVRDHRGERNPHFGHIMKQESREAIANKQRQRYEMLRQIVDNKTVTEARVREVIKETINENLAKNAVPAENKNDKPIDIRL
jgi:hypothetical protein